MSDAADPTARTTRSGTRYDATSRATPVNAPSVEPAGTMADDNEDTGRKSVSLKSIVYLFSQQYTDGKIVRFTGSGSKANSRAHWERFSEAVLVACFEYDDLFEIVHKILRGPASALETEEPPAATPAIKRLLFALLKTTTGTPASLALTKPEISADMDGVRGLIELRRKHEPVQKSAYRKHLIMDVVLFQLGDNHPESSLMTWVKAIETLKNAGCKTFDDLLKDILVNSLTPDYSFLLTSWDENGGVDKLDKGDMIKSIVTHFEHVILPGKPAGREKLHSAYDRYREHTGAKPRNHTRGRDGGNKGRSGSGGKDGKANGGGKKNDGSYADHTAKRKKNQGLAKAQQRQREKESEEKAKNITCSACGAKGHSPSSPSCPKRKKKVTFEDEKKKSGSTSSAAQDEVSTLQLAESDDGFYYLPPRDSGAEK